MNLLFTTNWKYGSVNDNIIDYCKKNKLDWHYNHYFEMEILFNGKWTRTDYDYNKSMDELKIIEKE